MIIQGLWTQARNLRKKALPGREGLGGRVEGDLPNRAVRGGCTRRSHNRGKVNGRPSAALAGRGARAGPRPGRRRGGARGPAKA